MNLPSQYFRAGAGAAIINKQKLVLVLERADVSGSWQLPQGGIEGTEEPLQAILREIGEETSINENDLKLLDSYPEPLIYELPVAARSEKTGRGQVQYWFLFEFTGTDESINVQKGGEFKSWKWLSFQQLLNLAVDFRKPVYQKVADRFELHS